MKLTGNRKRVLSITWMLTVVLFTFAQKAPMKYGKVDPADLSMTVYAADSSAAAVILCEYGYFDSNQFQFVHQRRIKILKEEGKSWGNFHVPAAEKTNVKGQVVNIENGVPVVTKLGKDGIFIEKVTRGSYQARVAMPSVKVGSVIDVEFYYDGLPGHWSFQKTIPVRWSELVIEESPYFSFRKNFNGYVPLAESSNDRWVTKNVPAFKSEPYMDNVENYLSSFDIELLRINFPNRYHEFATSWETVANNLRSDNDFGMQFKTFNLFLNGLEKDIKSAGGSKEDMMKRAYAAMKRVKWDKTEALFPGQFGLSEAYKKKIGNSADINLSLIILLRKLDIETNPVVISTRDNGLLPPFSVSADKLNYVIAQATIDDKTYLLDATDENCPAGMLPERAINGKGLVIKNDMIDWADLSAKKKDKTSVVLDLKLSADGVLKGHCNRSMMDYAALDQRNHYKTFNSQDDYLKSFEGKYTGLSVDNYSIVDLDSVEKPLREEFNIVYKNKVTKANGQMYLTPVLFDRFVENPLKANERLYPVNFTTPQEKTQVLTLELPDGYVVDQLPKNVKMALPENSAVLQMQSTVIDNKVQILFKVQFNNAIFYQPQYLDLKTFFDELVKKQAEMLIIKKAA